jgi:hypothetical protein
MSEDDVTAILGPLAFDKRGEFYPLGGFWIKSIAWRDGPNGIDVFFETDRAASKNIHLASTWETLTWYAKSGAAKVGVKW